MIHALLLQAQMVEKTGGFMDAVGGKLLWLLMVGIAVVFFGAIFKVLAHRYVKVPPEKALIIYGGGQTQIVTGGAKWVVPFVRDFYELDLTNFDVPLEMTDVPNADRIPTTLKAFAICRISNNEPALKVAARTFGRQDKKMIAVTVRNTLEGHLRVVIGRMKMDQILSEREQFNKEIQDAAATELSNIGCEIVIMNIQEVTDKHGIIDALGRPEAAKVQAEAAIQEAEQNRRRTVEVSTKTREASTISANNDAEVAAAQRDLNKRKAGYDAEVAAEQAKAAQAGPLAQAEAEKAVRVAKVDAEQAETEARIALQETVGRKTKAELEATVIKQAEAEAMSKKIVADGTRQQSVITAEGEKEARIIKAGAEAEALKVEAGGKSEALKVEADAQASKTRVTGTAQAEVTQKVGLAEAAATQARLEAEAKGETAKAEALKAKLLAEADGATAQAHATRALLEAQADGARKLNEAYAGLTAEQRQLFMLTKVMEMSPAIIAAIGEAGAKVTAELAQAMTAAYGSVGSVSIYDSGNGNGKGALDRWTSGPGDFLFKLVTGLKQSGTLSVASGILKQMTGVDLEQLVNETDLTTINATATAVTGDADGSGNGPIVKKDKPAATARS
jgi:flotillin